MLSSAALGLVSGDSNPSATQSHSRSAVSRSGCRGCQSFHRATRACAAGAFAQFGKGREDFSSSAFALSTPTSFPSLPDLPDHSFYMVTPGGSDIRDAVADLLSLSSWFVAACSTSEAGVSHVHYLVALPEQHDDWISRHRTIRSRFRRLPCVQYLTGYLVFSKITDTAGLRDYLTGPRNSARFFEILNAKKISVTFSTHARTATHPRRAIWDPIPLTVPKSRKKYISDGLGWSRGSVTTCKPRALQAGGTERLQPMAGREKSVKTTEARQPHWLPGFCNSSNGDMPVSDGFRSGYI